MDHSLLAVLLLAAGLCILVLEVFIPSGGVLFVISSLCLGVSFFMAWKAWYAESPERFALYLTSVVVLIPASLATAFYVLPRTPFGKRILLEAPTSEDVDAYAVERERLRKLVGRRGKAVTPLMPGGVVRIDNERFQATSEGRSLDSGDPIIVRELRGTTLVVARDSHTGEQTADNAVADRDGVDFEVPEA